jgi:hypothetical protein
MGRGGILSLVESISRHYAGLIDNIRRSPYLTDAEKQATIRNLKNERKQAIRSVRKEKADFERAQDAALRRLDREARGRPKAHTAG